MKGPPENETAAKDVGPGGGDNECSQSLESLTAHSTEGAGAATTLSAYTIDRWLHVEVRS